MSFFAVYTISWYFIFLDPCVVNTNEYRTKFEAWNPQSGYNKYQSGRKSLTEYPNSPAAICKALDIMHQKVGEALFQKSRKTSIKLYINKLKTILCWCALGPACIDFGYKYPTITNK